MMPDRQSDGPRGLYCPKCAAELHRRYIAKSYPSPGGQYRLRYCPTLKCPGFNDGVETLEIVIGFEHTVLDISDLAPEDVRALRSMIRQMRKLAKMKATFERIERRHRERAK